MARSGALPVTQHTLSKQWRKRKALSWTRENHPLALSTSRLQTEGTLLPKHLFSDIRTQQKSRVYSQKCTKNCKHTTHDAHTLIKISTAWIGIKPRLHDTTCCQTGFTTGRLNEQWLFLQHGCETGFDNRVEGKQWLFVQRRCQTSLTTGWMFVYTILPVVNRFDNQLYRVNGV